MYTYMVTHTHTHSSHLLVTIQGDKVAAAHILADITKQLAALVAALNK